MVKTELTHKKLAELIKKEPFLTENQYRIRLGVHITTLKKFLEKLEKRRIIQKRELGDTKKYRIYWVKDEDKIGKISD